ncbi:MAG: diaminopimelate epimerase [Candidatus Omnitrophica bacterium]|nr:diaminopimelate epimerase [Candidatus Omnitrophota bacterium]
MRKKIPFVKLVGAGNDFVLVDVHKADLGVSINLSLLAQKICDRINGAGADGLLVVERSLHYDVRMRIFNPDGSEAQMCGNGVRCLAYYVAGPKAKNKKISIQTKAGLIKAQVSGNQVRVELTRPNSLRENIPLKIGSRILHVNYINTGVPHTVIFVEGLDKIDVQNLGRFIRFHKRFAPEGTNVNFVEVIKEDTLKVRTYERGVEQETLACGTGSTAAALITGIKLEKEEATINVVTRSAEILKIYFRQKNKQFEKVQLEGTVKITYKGEFYV